MPCRGVPQPAAAARQLRPGGGDLAAALHPAAHAGLGAGALPRRLPGGPLWQPLGPGGQIQSQVRDLQVGAPAGSLYETSADTCAMCFVIVFSPSRSPRQGVHYRFYRLAAVCPSFATTATATPQWQMTLCIQPCRQAFCISYLVSWEARLCCVVSWIKSIWDLSRWHRSSKVGLGHKIVSLHAGT